MTEEIVSATTTISASAETVFAVLADPSRHAAVDGTGRVRDSLDDQRLTGPGQIFRVAMYHENHPDGGYEMCNLVLAFEPPRVISWKPGYVSPETGRFPRPSRQLGHLAAIVARQRRPPARTEQDSRSVPWFAVVILLMRSKSTGGTIALSIRGLPVRL